MAAHNLLQKMYAAPHLMMDPGPGGTIFVDRQLALLEMVSAGAETRTLIAPSRPGIRFLLRLKTDGGDVTVTAAEGLNATGNTQAVFADEGDQLDLVSVSKSGGGYRWEVLINTGAVALS